MEDEERQEYLAIVEKMLFKTQEVAAMMKQGQFIVAYEKLGGVIKNLGFLGGRLQHQQQFANKEVVE